MSFEQYKIFILYPRNWKHGEGFDDLVYQEPNPPGPGGAVTPNITIRHSLRASSPKIIPFAILGG